MRRRSHAAWVLPALLGIACGEAASDNTAGAPAPAPAAAATGGTGGSAPGAAAPVTPPPEKEVESDYEAPVATDDFVWIANPKSGRVAYVDAKTLEVKTVEAGNGPTYLASVPGQAVDSALVLNVLSSDATLFRVTSGGIETKTFPVAPKATSLAFSTDGRYAIAWADWRRFPSAPKTEGFQDLTVLDLVSGTSTILAVGYRPVAVGFAAGLARAYAVTQDGVALLSTDGAPVVTKNVALSDTPNEDPGSRDVSVTPDGRIALIRRDDSAAITAINLETGGRTTVTLPGPVTDLDLVAKGDRAIAVVRSTSQAIVLPIPGIVSAPTSFTTVTATGEVIGSVSLAPSGTRGLLYTNASAVERVTVLDIGIDPPALRTVRLYAPVLAAFSAPDAGHALVLHDAVAGSPGAFSLVPVVNALPAKIVAMRARPAAVAITNDRAIVSERDDASKVFGAYVARLPQLMVERHALASPPIAVGVVPSAKRAFIAQKHPDGRLTFVDLESGQARTLTGFELSARVVDGSKP